jgi:hypothetical protein
MERFSARYRDLLLSFRIKNTLRLDGGRCACLLCRKLFRSIDFLNLHFERSHALELQALKQQSQADPSLRPPLQKGRTSILPPVATRPSDDLNAVHRAERQAYLEFDRVPDE